VTKSQADQAAPAQAILIITGSQAKGIGKLQAKSLHWFWLHREPTPHPPAQRRACANQAQHPHRQGVRLLRVEPK
jgi:hypothetical protein